MDEKIEKTSAIVERLIDSEIQKGLTKHNVAVTSPVTADLRARVQVLSGVGETLVRIIDDRNRVLTIDAYLAELKRNPEYARHFPSVPQISVTDMVKLSANLTKIARGEVEVVDEL